MTEFQRIKRLPPYVFSIVTDLKNKARRAGEDIIDLGMGNPDLAPPPRVVNKLAEAVRNPAQSSLLPFQRHFQLRLAICEWYKKNYDVDLDPENEAIVTIGAKDALAHLVLARWDPAMRPSFPNPCYPIHQYTEIIMAEGHACMLPMLPDPATFLNSLDGSLQEVGLSPPQTAHDSDLFPSQPYHGNLVDIGFLLKSIIRMAAHHGTMVVHDFAYADIGFDGYKAS